MTDAIPTVLVAAANDVDLNDIGEALPQGEVAPLATRGWAQIAGSLGDIPIAAALIHFSLDDCDQVTLSRRLKGLPGRAKLPIMLLREKVGAGVEDSDPFEAAIRFPSAPGVLADNLRRLLARHSAGAQDALTSLQAELAERYRGISKQTYYQILQVTPSVPRAELTRAYDDFSVRFHPDRLLGIDNDKLKKQAQHFFVLLTEAYQTLSDAVRRQRYNKGLRTGKLRYDPSVYQTVQDFSQVTNVNNAKRYLRLAQKEQFKGDAKAALVFLRMALQVDPDNDDIKSKIAEVEAK